MRWYPVLYYWGHCCCGPRKPRRVCVCIEEIGRALLHRNSHDCSLAWMHLENLFSSRATCSCYFRWCAVPIFTMTTPQNHRTHQALSSAHFSIVSNFVSGLQRRLLILSVLLPILAMSCFRSLIFILSCAWTHAMILQIFICKWRNFTLCRLEIASMNWLQFKCFITLS